MVAVVAVAAVAMSVAAGYGPARDPIETRLLYPSAVSKKKKEHVIEFKQTFFYLRSFVNKEKLPPWQKQINPLAIPRLQ